MQLNTILSKILLQMRDKRWLLIILILALVIRFIFIALFPNWDKISYLDSNRYQRVADNIRTNHGFVEWRLPTAFAPPLYSYFIAAVNSVFGKNSISVKIIQIILSVVSIFCIYLVGKNTFGQRVGILAAFCMAINPEIVVMAGTLYTETLFIFLTMLAFSLLFWSFKKPFQYGRWIVLAFVLGLAILTRHILILFPVILVGFTLIVSSLKRFRKSMTLFAFLCYLVLVPWTLRNYVIFDRFIPVAMGTGGGLWHGMSYNSHYQYEKSRETVAQETRGLDSPVEKEYLLMQKSLHAIKNNPIDFVKRFFNKFFRFFTEVYEDIPQGMERKPNLIVIIILSLSYYPILLFCILGMIIFFKQWRHLFPLYGIIFYSGIFYSITFVAPRYRIPLLPFMILFACAGLVEVFRHAINLIHPHKKSFPVKSMDAQ